MMNRRQFIASTIAGLSTFSVMNGQAAMPVGKPNSIDVHAHWTPFKYAEKMASLGRPTFANGSQLNPLMFDLEKRLEWMDNHNIYTHVLTLSGNMPWWWADEQQAIELARIVNEEASFAHHQYPERFLIGLALPMRHPDRALEELNRMAGKPGVCAVGLPNSMNGQDYLFEPKYKPLLARIEELGYPLLFHPLDFPPNYFGGPDRLAGKSFLYNTVGFPTEHANTAAKMIMSGYLDEFPKLKILLAHAGGSFPFIMGRIEHSIRKGASNIQLKRPFQEYVRRFYYDTLTYSPIGLKFLIENVGIDRIVIGSDVFAIMDVSGPNDIVEQIKLSSSDAERIYRQNALKLLNLST